MDAVDGPAWILAEIDGFEGQVGVIYMFYDTEGALPSITRDDAYSLHFKPYILESLVW